MTRYSISAIVIGILLSVLLSDRAFAQPGDVIDTTYTSGSNTNLMYHDPDTSVAGVPEDYNGDGVVDWQDAYDFAEDAAFVTQSGNGVVPDLSDLDDVIDLMRIYGGEATPDPGDSSKIICSSLQRAAEVLNFPYTGRYPSRAELDDINTGPCDPPLPTPPDLGLPGGPGPFYCLGIDCPDPLIDLLDCDSVAECDDDILIVLGGGIPPIAEDVEPMDEPHPLLVGEDWTPLLDDHGTGPGGDLILVGNMCPDGLNEITCGFNDYSSDEFQVDHNPNLGGPWYPEGWEPSDSTGLSGPPLALEDMYPGGWGLGSGDSGFGEPVIRNFLFPYPTPTDSDDGGGIRTSEERALSSMGSGVRTAPGSGGRSGSGGGSSGGGGSGGGGSGSGGGGEGGGEEGGDSGNPCDQDPEGGGEGVYHDPIMMKQGHKYEMVTDAVVSLPGTNFRLVRTYNSSPDARGPSLIGNNWSANIFAAVYFDSTVNTVFLHNGSTHKHVGYAYNSSSATWKPTGTSQKYIDKTTITIDSAVYPVWRLNYPSGGRAYFFRAPDSGESVPSTGPYSGSGDYARVENLIVRTEDAYGTGNTYVYGVYGTTSAKARLKTIHLACSLSSTANTDTQIRLAWYLVTGEVGGVPIGIDHPLNGKLARLLVVRDADGTPIETQRLEYTYKHGLDGFSEGLGTGGDLIQVVKYTRVDAWTDSTTPHTPTHPHLTFVSQYRYHDITTPAPTTGDVRLRIEGDDHQLKMVIHPEQLEYAAQQLNRGGYLTHPSSAIRDLGHRVMRLDDDMGVFKPEGSSDFIDVLDLATKIVGYDTTSGKVDEQFVQAGCGCGPAAQGIKQVLSYETWPGGVSAVVTETLRDTLGTYTTSYRTLRFDLKSLTGGLKGSYLQHKVITDNTGSGRKWVWRFEYSDTDAPGLVNRVWSPAAIASYTAPTPTTAPSTTAASDSFVTAYDYNSEGRRIETAVAESSSPTVRKPIIKIHYPSSSGAGERTYLPTKIERYTTSAGSPTADDIETIWFEYGFDGSATTSHELSWRRTIWEAETEAENGPASGLTHEGVTVYDSYRLFNDKGQVTWLRRADQSIVGIEYDETTAAVTKRISNAAINSVPTTDYSGITFTSWGTATSGGTFEWTTERNAMGQSTKLTSPGGIVREVYREARPIDRGHVEERPGIHHLVTTLLPAKDGTDLESTVMMTASGSIGKVYESSFTVDTGETYAKANLEDLLDEEVNRTTWQYGYTGFLQSVRAWPDASSSEVAVYDETTYERDGVGRLLEIVSPDGSVMAVTSYDVMGRPLGIEIGTTSSSSLEKVVDYYYDDPDTDTTPEQGVGNGLLSWTKRHFGENAAGSSDSTKSEFHVYDFRDRWVRSEGPSEDPTGPYLLVEYDNLNRVVSAGLFTSAATSMTDSSREYYVELDYGQRGLLYRQRVATNPDPAGSATFLDAHYWRDASGRPIAFWGIGGPTHKRTLDGHGRVVDEYITDRADDDLPGATGNYDDALNVSGDRVISQTSYTYDSTINRVGLITTRERLHDTSATGALGSSTSVAQYVGIIYDDLTRPIRVIDYGTNGSAYASGTSAPTWPPGTTPSFDTSGWGDTRIVAFEYDEQGRHHKTIDPMGVVSLSQFDDYGRVIASIENYKNATVSWTGSAYTVLNITQSASGTPAADAIGTDRVTTYEYDAGRLVRETAHNHDGTTQSAQHTEYVYGVTAASSSGDMNSLLDSNRLIKEVRFPDPTTGSPSTSNAIKVAYNLLGQVRGVEDQNGTIHRYDRDQSGRVVSDRVATFGSGAGLLENIDEIAVEFDSLGRTSKILSKKNGAIKNAVEATYTDAWQLAKVFQDYDGDITKDGSGDPTGNTKLIEYAYSVAQLSANGGNYSRPTKVTYPSGTEVTYDYGTTASLNDRLSRLVSMDATDFADDLVRYEWLGAGVPVLTEYPVPEIELDRIHGGDGSSTAGTYKGFDHFGQLERHLWVDDGFGPHGTISGMPNGPPLVDLAFERNEHGSPTTRRDARPGVSILDRDFQLGYDGLNRLIQADRGQYDGTTFTTDEGGNAWELDLLTNVNAVLTDENGDGDYGDVGDTSVPRTFDKTNEILTLGSGGSQITYTHDDNGNLKTVSGGNEYKYDAWDRLVRVIDGNLTIAEYDYNGLFWRIARREDTNGSAGLDLEVTYVYSPNWQIIEEETDLACNGTCDEAAQYFWGARYLDDIIARRIDHDADGDYSDVGTRTYFYATDERGSPVAIVDATGALMERVDYDSYGVARHRWPGDIDGDGDTDSSDEAIFDTLDGFSFDYDDSEYDCDLDLNRDGVADTADHDLFDTTWKGLNALSSGQISDPDGPNSAIGMAGYVWSPKAEVYCVRYRYYDPLLGRWHQRDPAGYVDGLNLYTYGMGNPWAYTDPYGLYSLEEFGDDLKEYGGLARDGLAEFGDLITGRAAREDAEHVEMIRETEEAQKDKVCENYQNGNATADEAAALYNKIDGMADDLENSLEELRKEEWDMIEETAKEIAMTIIPGGIIVRAATRGIRGLRLGRLAGRGCRGAACGIGGRACFVAGTVVLMASGDLAAIESIELGDRVESAAYVEPPTYGSLEFGHAAAADHASPFINDYKTIDPAFWCIVELSMSFEDGSRLSATLLRPQVWLVHADVAEGETIWLELPETGLVGFADVVSISAAPASIEPGQQAAGTVTGRFATIYAETIDLYLDSSTTPLGVTPTHPVWSLSREGWVAAGDLYRGESVATMSGSTMVVGTVPAGERTVHNLEVLGHHTYFVGEDAVWVHNNCPRVARTKVRRGQGPRGIERIDRPHGPTGQFHAHPTKGKGGALNVDGTIHDGHLGMPQFSNKAKQFLKDHGWTIPDNLP